MGKPGEMAVDAARKDIAAAISKFVQMAHQAVEDLTPEDVKAGFSLSQREAPMWTNLVSRVVTSAARSETEHPSTVNNTLQLVMVERASSTEKWLETVEGLKKKKQLPPIDVEPEPKK
jgi:septum formation topological specificity factor MinE